MGQRNSLLRLRRKRPKNKTLGDFAMLALQGAVGAVAAEIASQLDEEIKKQEGRIPKKVKEKAIEAEYVVKE